MPAKFGDPRSQPDSTNFCEAIRELTNFICSNRTTTSLNCFIFSLVIAVLVYREVRVLLLSLHAFAFLPGGNPGMIFL